MQLEQERRKSNGLAQALQREKEQHFIVQQQVCTSWASYVSFMHAPSSHGEGSCTVAMLTGQAKRDPSFVAARSSRRRST